MISLRDHLRQKFPPWREVFTVFLLILFPVNFWALIFFFRELPSYLLRMRIWEILGVLAYIQVIVLLDSLFLLAIIIVLTLIVPRRFIRDHFITASFFFVVVSVAVAVFFHYKFNIIEFIHSLNHFWAALGLFGLLAGGLALGRLFIPKYQAFENGIQRFVEKLTVVSSVYLVFNIMGILVVIIRNFGLH